MIMRSIRPSPVSLARPLSPEPALFETAVRFLSPFLCIASMSVSAQIVSTHNSIIAESLNRAQKSGENIPATPQRPNPALRMTDPSLRSATASSADLNTLEPPRLDLGPSVEYSLWTSGAYSCAVLDLVADNLLFGAAQPPLLNWSDALRTLLHLVILL